MENKILVIDDSPLTLKSIEIAFKDKYEVATFESAEVALKYLETETADLIILDIKMPQMDGFEVFDIINSNERTSNIPVIFLSSLNKSDNELKALEAGAYDYIEKPFSTHYLKIRVELYINLINSMRKIEMQNQYLEKYSTLLKRKYDQASDKLENIMQNIPGGVISINVTKGFDIEYANDGFLDMTGYNSVELFGGLHQKTFDFVHEEDIMGVMSGIKSQMLLSNHVKLQFRIKHKSGDIIWVELRAQAMKNENDEQILFCVVTDRTEMKIAEDSLKARELHYRTIADGISGGIMLLEPNDILSIKYLNDGFLKMLGYSKEQVQSRFNNNAVNLIAPEDRENTIKSIFEQLSKNDTFECEPRIITGGGNIFTIIRGKYWEDHLNNKMISCVILNHNKAKIAELELAASHERYRIITEQSKNIIFEVNIRESTLAYTPNFNKIFGKIPSLKNFPHNIIGKDMVHPDDMSDFFNFLRKAFSGEKCEKIEVRLKKADGAYSWCMVRITMMSDSENKPYKFIGQISDIAYIDKLTGARNRNKFEIDAASILTNTKNTHAFVLLDIDRFRLLNDSLGHDTGDAVLKIIARIIEENLSRSEVFARITADQFYLLLNYGSDDEIRNRMLQIQEWISQRFSDEINPAYNFVLCCAIYVIRDELVSINGVSDRARIALRTAKGSTHNVAVFYDEKIREEVRREKDIENKMKSALNNGEFELYLQPKFNIQSEKIVGAEALVRWEDPNLGMFLPKDFIPIFENNGFIIQMDMYMLELVCKTIAQRLPIDFLPMGISVNLSRQHLSNPNLANQIDSIVRKYHVPSRLIEIELNENTFFENEDILVSMLDNLHSCGFTVSMDDFGTGYSSLALLKNLPVDSIKLDKTFFTGYKDKDRAKAVITNIIRMAKSLNIYTVAEGVETEEDYNFLKELKCDIVQGFYFEKPMKAEEFFELTQKKKKVRKPRSK